MKKLNFGVYLTLALAGVVAPAFGQNNNIYGNNADGTPYILVMDPNTFAVTQTLENLSGSNGRGVVAVNGIIYYTSAGTNSVYSYTLATHTNNGAIFSVAGTTALSTMAFDGTNFWIGDYGGTGQAYLYSQTGTLLKTIHLGNCAANCDGLEFFLQGGATPRLISNRGDSVGPYDIYDTNGTLITPSFINPPFRPTGIAYNGTNFLVSDIFNGKIDTYNGASGAFISATPITGALVGFAPLIEDLSADYAVVLGPQATPAPATLALLLFGLVFVGLATMFLRRRQSV